MHAVSISLDRAESDEQMVFKPPVECPICRDVLELDRTLEGHLVETHTHIEVARYVASRSDQVEVQPISD
ncbi:hypothetical protein [Natrinema pallidum]